MVEIKKIQPIVWDFGIGRPSGDKHFNELHLNHTPQLYFRYFEKSYIY